MQIKNHPMPIKNFLPIPVHCECKGTRGKLRPAQVVERDRILRSGSKYILISRPSEFYDFLNAEGFKNFTVQFTHEERVERSYKEKEVVAFVRQLLKWLEKIYGVLWYYNMQNIGSKLGRPDFYFELPRREL